MLKCEKEKLYIKLDENETISSEELNIGYSTANSNTYFKGCMQQPKLQQKIFNLKNMKLRIQMTHLEEGCKYSTMHSITLNEQSSYVMILKKFLNSKFFPCTNYNFTTPQRSPHYTFTEIVALYFCIGYPLIALCH
jgi:hypothetical protein